MRAAVHFFLVAGVVIVSIAGATWVLDALGVPMVPGFGWDDVIFGTIVATGVTVGMSAIRSFAKAA